MKATFTRFRWRRYVLGPNITKEKFACLGRSDEVIALLKRLPYIKMNNNYEYMIAPQTYQCDYRRNHFQSPAFTNSRPPYEIPYGFEYPPWVVPSTYGKNDGSYLMLDTTDGTVTDYRVTGGGYPPDYEDGDPRSWRNECEDRTLKLEDFLNEWKAKHQTITWMGLTLGHPEIWWIDYRSDPQKTTEFREIQEIIHANGWPVDFNREECKQVLENWNA
ncbi:hypothetical protein V8E51_006063 [Hyaloscypha variabilis]